MLRWPLPKTFRRFPTRVRLSSDCFALNYSSREPLESSLSGGNLSPGIREDRSNRWVIGAFALIGLLAGYLPAYTDRIGFWTLDGDAIRWLGVVLFASHSVWALAGHKWCLWRHSPPELSGVTRQLTGMGPRFSVGDRHSAYGVHYSSTPCANTRGGNAAQVPVRRSI